MQPLGPCIATICVNFKRFKPPTTNEQNTSRRVFESLKGNLRISSSEVPGFGQWSVGGHIEIEIETNSRKFDLLHARTHKLLTQR